MCLVSSALVSCGGTTAVGPAPAPPSAADTDAIWFKPDAGCPTGTEGPLPDSRVCAVCNWWKKGDCSAKCQAGDGGACAIIAMHYESGIGNPVDSRKSNEFFEMACDLKSAQGCMRLARQRMTGEGCSKDEPAGLAIFDRLCNGGRGEACTAAGVAHIAGRGAAADSALGLKLLKQGCALGSTEGCLLLENPLTPENVDAAVSAARAEERRAWPAY